jgi:hypothetical protein
MNTRNRLLLFFAILFLIRSSQALELPHSATQSWGAIPPDLLIDALTAYTLDFHLSVAAGDLILLSGGWYVTHVGLIRPARRRRCAGIHVEPAAGFSEPAVGRWAFKATVYKSRTCKGFVGYGDADPSNVSTLVRGAEMRVAETRAVNRALRKAYGIGICSVEEIGSFAGTSASVPSSKKIPPQPVNGRNSADKWSNHTAPLQSLYASQVPDSRWLAKHRHYTH